MKIDFTPKYKTFEEELEAVKENGNSLIYINEQSPLIVYYAIKSKTDLDNHLIHITEEEWLQYEDENPELFL